MKNNIKVGHPIQASISKPYDGHTNFTTVLGKVIEVGADSLIVDIESGSKMEFKFTELGESIWLLPLKSDIDRVNVRQIRSITNNSAINKIVVTYTDGKDIDYIVFSPEKLDEITEIARLQKVERFKRCGEAMDLIYKDQEKEHLSGIDKLYLASDKLNKTSKEDSDMIEGQGKRVRTEQGAQRDSSEGRGRFDLFPFESMEALAIWFEKGAARYGDRDWEKGSSVKDAINRMIRHAIKAGSGWTDEDHLAAVMWNASCAITMMKRRPDCNDHAWKDENIEPKFNIDKAIDGQLTAIQKENKSDWKKANPAILADERHGYVGEFIKTLTCKDCVYYSESTGTECYVTNRQHVPEGMNVTVCASFKQVEEENEKKPVCAECMSFFKNSGTICDPMEYKACDCPEFKEMPAKRDPIVPSCDVCYYLHDSLGSKKHCEHNPNITNKTYTASSLCGKFKPASKRVKKKKKEE